MKIYLNKTVLEAAKERINRVFDEFDTVVVSYSGGKDSVVVLELALEVAKERGRLPLPVLFLDQEFEWCSTIEQVRHTMGRPEVKPYWVQLPFIMDNSAAVGNGETTWVKLWERGKSDDWYVQPKDPSAIHDTDVPNLYTDETEFYDMFPVLAKYFFGTNVAYLAGLRAEENPVRYMATTTSVKYKDITWANSIDKKNGNYTFYPIYDWTTGDVWKAIYDGGWRYSERYDWLYRYGSSIGNMRVSALIHETAVGSLYELQEMEPELYERVIKRVQGADTIAKMGAEDFVPRELPFMFTDWEEYALYLYDHLVEEDKFPLMAKNWKAYTKQVKKYTDNFPELHEGLWREMAKMVIGNDGNATRIKTVLARPAIIPYKKRLKKIMEAKKNEANGKV